MFAVKLQWHSHNVNLQAVETYVKANFPNCVGNSADSVLTFWFTEVLSYEQVSAIEAYWMSLDEESVEATSYVSNEAIIEATNTLRAGLISKSWDSMSVAEKKLVLGQAPTKSELGL